MLRRISSQPFLRIITCRLLSSSLHSALKNPPSHHPFYFKCPYTHSMLASARGPSGGAERQEDEYWNDLFASRPDMADLNVQDHPFLSSSSSSKFSPHASHPFTADLNVQDHPFLSSSPSPSTKPSSHGGAKAGAPARKSKLPFDAFSQRSGERHLFGATFSLISPEEQRGADRKARLCSDRRMLQLYASMRKGLLQRRRLSTIPTPSPQASSPQSPPPSLDFLAPSFEASTPHHSTDVFIYDIDDLALGNSGSSYLVDATSGSVPLSVLSSPRRPRLRKKSSSKLVIPSTSSAVPTPLPLPPLTFSAALVSSLPRWASGRSVQSLARRPMSVDKAQQQLLKSLSAWSTSRNKWFPVVGGPVRKAKTGGVGGQARGLWTGAPWISGAWGYDGPYKNFQDSAKGREEAWVRQEEALKKLLKKVEKKSSPPPPDVIIPPAEFVPPRPLPIVSSDEPLGNTTMSSCPDVQRQNRLFSSAENFVYGLGVRRPPRALRRAHWDNPPNTTVRQRQEPPRQQIPLIIMGLGIWALPVPSSSSYTRPFSTRAEREAEEEEEERDKRIREAVDFSYALLLKRKAETLRPLPPHRGLHSPDALVCPVTPSSFPSSLRKPLAGPRHFSTHGFYDAIHPSDFALRGRAEEERYLRSKEADDAEEARTMGRRSLISSAPRSVSTVRIDANFRPLRDDVLGVDPLSMPEFEHNPRPSPRAQPVSARAIPAFVESMLHGWGWKSGSLMHEFGWQSRRSDRSRARHDPAFLRRSLSTSAGADPEGLDGRDFDNEYYNWHNNKLRELSRRASASDDVDAPTAPEGPAVIIEYSSSPSGDDLDHDIDKVQRMVKEVRATLGLTEYSMLTPEVVLGLVKWKGSTQLGEGSDEVAFSHLHDKYLTMAQRYRELKNITGESDICLSDDALFSLLFWKDAGSRSASGKAGKTWGEALDWKWTSGDNNKPGAGSGGKDLHFPY